MYAYVTVGGRVGLVAFVVGYRQASAPTSQIQLTSPCVNVAGLCYAELAGLCPHTSGSAYMYAYVTVGELAAFVVGWGLVVEYVIGTAAGAVALSETLDSLAGGVVSPYLHHAATLVGR